MSACIVNPRGQFMFCFVPCRPLLIVLVSPAGCHSHFYSHARDLYCLLVIVHVFTSAPLSVSLQVLQCLCLLNVSPVYCYIYLVLYQSCLVSLFVSLYSFREFFSRVHFWISLAFGFTVYDQFLDIVYEPVIINKFSFYLTSGLHLDPSPPRPVTE